MDREKKNKKELEALQQQEANSADEGRRQVGRKTISREELEKPGGGDKTVPMGYNTIPLENLPTKGMFYPAGTRVMIRSADTAEIRHWSTIDENDTRDIIHHLNAIVKACTRIKTPQGAMDYRDIKEADRLFIVLSIRDLTFKEGYNRIMIPVEDPSTGDTAEVELKNNNLGTREIGEKFMEYYSPEDRNFDIGVKKTGDEFQLEPPSIGMSQKVTDFIAERGQSNSYVDKTFIRVYPYIQDDWRGMTTERLLKEQNKSKAWNQVTVSVLINFVEGIQVGQKPFVTHNFDGSAQEVTVPIKFPGGIKSLFLISDIFEEIL